MPELPEVETVRRGLAPVMESRRILSAEARRPDLRFPFPERFAERLTGTTITNLDRRAKYLVAHLGSGEALIMHLGMSGRFTIADTRQNAREPGEFLHARAVDPKHDHVRFAMEGGAAVTFNDPRRFGYMDLVAVDELATCKHFAALGPEPLADVFTGEALHAALSKKATPIKAALLDQRVVAGLGNIYVCEALFRAGIHPERLARTVTVAQARRLVVAIKAVLTEAIAAGGSSLRDHAGADGSLGYFQHAFAVYARAGEPCAKPRCPGVVERIVQSGRSTFLCRTCQT